MITARTTRLVRVPDLQTFRQAAVDLACAGTPFETQDRVVIVPTRAAGAYLLRAIEMRRVVPGGALLLPAFVTRRDLHAKLAERLPAANPPLGDAEREVLMGVACRMTADEGLAPPFRVRPALLAEIVDFYDTLQRHARDTASMRSPDLRVASAR